MPETLLPSVDRDGLFFPSACAGATSVCAFMADERCVSTMAKLSDVQQCPVSPCVNFDRRLYAQRNALRM